MNSRISGMSEDMIQALSKLEQDAKVELWEIDLRSKGGQLHRIAAVVHSHPRNEPFLSGVDRKAQHQSELP